MSKIKIKKITRGAGGLSRTLVLTFKKENYESKKPHMELRTFFEDCKRCSDLVILILKVFKASNLL